jgi:TorA maturation chaperone TorD
MTTMTEADELALLLARRELWLLVSAGFVDPYHRKRFGLLYDPAFRRRVTLAGMLLSEKEWDTALGPGEMSPKEIALGDLFASLDAGDGATEAAYRQVFGLTAISTTCPPCETEWEPNADIFYRTQQLADIAGFYRAFGLDLSSECGERLDHITVEAEFFYVLLAKEAAALSDGDREGVEICRDARRKFFQEHVGWWLPLFASGIGRMAPAGYYQHLARFTAALSAAERLSLKLPPFSPPTIARPSPGASHPESAGDFPPACALDGE